MFQTSIDEYTKIIDEKLPEYLASMPDPFSNTGLQEYVGNLPKDSSCFGLPLEWFDLGAVTSLIRNHEFRNYEYDINSYLIEILCTMFRVSMLKLDYVDDDEAQKLAELFAYDEPVDSITSAMYVHDLCFSMRRAHYSIENQVWYSYMFPLLAYSKRRNFDVPNYVARYLANIINMYGMTENDGSHVRDVNYDILRPNVHLNRLLNMCYSDIFRFLDSDDIIHRYEFIRNVLIEFSQVYLGCLLRRSSTHETFGKIANEFVAGKYMIYQEICQLYYNKKKKE